ncbi:hypothetical protein B0H14DRAFT_3449344 [Mycena olivaceomarginata]|nr:hypothetical protein B0H14DRAFT_3449344 [Mycena olivaceomarginata]
MSRMSVDLVSDHKSVPASEYQDSSEGVGGLKSDLDNGDGVDYARQRDEEKVGRGNLLKAKNNPLAGIVDTNAIGWVPLCCRKTGDKIKKSDIHVRHLPQHLQADFSKIFTPELIDMLAPFHQMAKIWDLLFPDYPLAADPDLQAIVLKLGDDKITAWRNKFTTTMLEALKDIFGHKGAETAQARADSVACLLEGEDKNFVFYYREYADEDGNMIKKVGSFKVTSSYKVLPPTMPASALPALQPNIQQQRTFPRPHSSIPFKRPNVLSTTQTGKLVIPGHHLGEFSRANWGDRMVFQKGRSVAVNSTSGLVKIVHKLQTIQT